jgi:hypothetical protein
MNCSLHKCDPSDTESIKMATYATHITADNFIYQRFFIALCMFLLSKLL